MEHHAIFTPRPCYDASLWPRIRARLADKAPAPTHELARDLAIPHGAMITILRSLELAGLLQSQRCLGTRRAPGAYWWDLVQNPKGPRATDVREAARLALDAMAKGAHLVRMNSGSWIARPTLDDRHVVIPLTSARGLLARRLVTIAAWDQAGEPSRLELAVSWPAVAAEQKPVIPNPRQNGLTERQRAVLDCLGEPRSVAEVATLTGISLWSVDSIVLSLRRRGLIVGDGGGRLGRKGVGARYRRAAPPQLGV